MAEPGGIDHLDLTALFLWACKCFEFGIYLYLRSRSVVVHNVDTTTDSVQFSCLCQCSKVKVVT